MTKRVVRRYELVVDNNLTEEKFIIPFRDKNGKSYNKNFLTVIDKTTMRFINKSHLLNYLKQKDYIDFEDADIYIRYYSAGSRLEFDTNKPTEKRLEVVYQNETKLPHFCQMESSYVDVNTAEFKKLFIQFLKDMDNGIFYRHALERMFINKRLKKLLEEYLYVKKNQFNEQAVQKEFSRYKVIRGYIIGKELFNKQKGKQDIPKEPDLPLKLEEAPVIKDSDVTKEPDFPPNSEELRQFQEYLEQLPDEVHPHSKDSKLGKTKSFSLPQYKNSSKGPDGQQCLY